MKKLAVLVLVALLGFGSASAQRNGDRRQMSVEQKVSNLKKELNLTDEQTAKVTVLYTDFEKKVKSAGENSREQMKSEREELEKQVQALLTDEQKKTYQEMQAKRSGGKGKGQRR